MEKICINCKWWNGHITEGIYRYNICNNTAFDNKEYPPNGIAADDEDYVVLTGPKFGCIHYESKPTS